MEPGEIIKKHTLSAVLRIVLFSAFIAVVFTHIFGIEITESDDMSPQIRAGDVLIYNRITPPGLRDAVVYSTSDGIRAGRIEAAQEGTVSATEDGQLLIGGRAQPVQEENGIFYDTYRIEGGADLPVTLEEKEYFILGDKRNTSRDSRIYGVIKGKSIKGKVFMILRRRAI